MTGVQTCALPIYPKGVWGAFFPPSALPKDGTVYQVSHEMWELAPTGLVYGESTTDYHRCDRCNHLTRLNVRGICPEYRCQGRLRPIRLDLDQQNHYSWLYLNMRCVPLQAMEHSAQLTSEHAAEVQQRFIRGEINALSCSTTFEMGIDLGDLQAVVMSNVPPTVANYRQRSGRAGRRTSGTAFILTWSQDRPHDQLHFRKPGEIIRGKVRVPYITLDNSVILRRHFNAVFLSKFLRHLRDEGYNPKELDSAGKFFDQHLETPAHYSRLAPWLDDCSPDIRAEMYSFRPWLNGVAETPIDAWIDAFVADLENVWVGHYQITAEYYYQEMERARTQQGDRRKAREREEKYEKLLKRFRDEKLINYLSGRADAAAGSAHRTFAAATRFARCNSGVRARLRGRR